MAYWILKVVLTPVFHVLWRVRVEGREHVPRKGPAILASSHQSFCDSFFIPLVVPRRVTYVAKAEYFDTWRTAWFFRAAGQIPMRRDGGDASERALATARDVLSSGGLLGIYPEGTRAPDTRLYRGKTGVARLALGCGVPVIPVSLVGTRRIQPPGKRLMRPFHSVTIRFGPPLDVAEELEIQEIPGGGVRRTAGVSSDPQQLRRITDQLMHDIAKLSGQEYVDEYASQVRARRDRARNSEGEGTDAGGRSPDHALKSPTSVP